ncbi:hypothetical protein [Priestia megaterium]|uniref:hypothetical protein n=1 Tax=Priestia megaterium TaxID=1404 RepID=UPI0020405FF4|nr:hypothetical protein [Priestia megaterium]MCM3195817.1 hypothetical protein [Priestia megaterium]
MASYVQWNEVICNHFYNQENSGKIVYLYVNSSVIKSLGREKFGYTEKEAINSFCKCIFDLSPYESRIFRIGFAQGMNWFKKGMEGIPPFIGLLALCVLAATKMGTNQDEGIGGGNYYHPLRELLDSLESSGKPLYFEKTVKLWKILYKWQKKNNFNFGITPSFPYGTSFTGYPRSQCLIRDSDRLMLNEFFEWANYNEKSLIDKGVLKNQLSRFLESRGGRLSNLFFMKKQSYQKQLVMQISVELESWKRNKHFHIMEDTSKFNSIPNIKRKNEMFLVLKFEGRLSKSIGEVYFLSQFKDDLKYDNFRIDNIELNTPFIRKELSEFDEITLDYHIDIDGYDISLDYRGNGILFLKQGNDIGINGWVNKRIVETNKDYIILYKNAHHDLIKKWLCLNNISIKSTIKRGLPEKYSLIMITTGQDIEGIDDLETSNNYFVIDRNISLKFEGGLKIAHSEWMYSFPPEIRVVAPTRSEVKVNNLPSFSLLSNEVCINSRDLFLKSGKYCISTQGKNRNITITQDKEINHDSETTIVQSSVNKINDFNNLGVKYVSSNKTIDLWAHPKKTDFFQLEESEEQILDIHVSSRLNSAQPYSRRFSELVSILGLTHNPEWRTIDTFIEYLTYLGKGNRSSFIRGIKECFRQKDVNLTTYIVTKNLVSLGLIEVEYQRGTNQFYWEINPTAAGYIPCSHEQHVLYVTGSRTRKWLSDLKEQYIRGVDIYYYNPKSEFEPISIYVTSRDESLLHSFLGKVSIYHNKKMSEYFSFELARCVPATDELLNYISSVDEKLYNHTEFESWDYVNNRWSLGHSSNLIRIRNDYFKKYFIRENNKLLEVDREIGKVVLAAQNNIIFFTYRPFVFKVKKQYHLPDIFERTLSLCSGICPLETNTYRVYQNVPLEIALMVIYKLGFKKISL